MSRHTQRVARNLYVRSFPTGRSSYMYRFTHNNKRTWIKLPGEPPHTTSEQASRLARFIDNELSKGIHPKFVRDSLTYDQINDIMGIAS